MWIPLFIRQQIGRFKTRFGAEDLARSYSDEQPLRLELFSIEHLSQHAKAVAGWHEINPRRGPDRLLARLADNELVLMHARELVTAAVTANREVTPAAEWLLDNFYLVEEQI